MPGTWTSDVLLVPRKAGASTRTKKMPMQSSRHMKTIRVAATTLAVVMTGGVAAVLDLGVETKGEEANMLTVSQNMVPRKQKRNS